MKYKDGQAVLQGDIVEITLAGKKKQGSITGFSDEVDDLCLVRGPNGVFSVIEAEDLILVRRAHSGETTS